MIHGHACTLGTVISYRHLIHLTLLLCVLVPPVTRILYTCISYTCVPVTWVIYTVIACTYRMNLFVYMLWFFTVPDTWIFLYFCYMTISCYWYRYDSPVTGHECYWYAMCETKYHVDLSHGVTSKSHISCFLFPVILFYDINKAHILLSYYLYHTLF